MRTEAQKVDRTVGYVSGCIVVYEDTMQSRRVVARIPNKGWPARAQLDAQSIAAAPDMVKALRVAESLLDSVAFVTAEGDTDEPLALIRAALVRVGGDA